MPILIATDAWHPQVNGVVRTLTSLASSASALGTDIEFLTPEGFPSMPVPTYPGLRIALPNRSEIARRIEAVSPDAIHIATEGPIGWAVRAYCRRRKLAFTTSYTTRFPEYVSVRTGIPESIGYAVMRRFHSASSMVMVATDSLRRELAEQVHEVPGGEELVVAVLEVDGDRDDSEDDREASEIAAADVAPPAADEPRQGRGLVDLGGLGHAMLGGLDFGGRRGFGAHAESPCWPGTLVSVPAVMASTTCVCVTFDRSSSAMLRPSRRTVMRSATSKTSWRLCEMMTTPSP